MGKKRFVGNTFKKQRFVREPLPEEENELEKLIYSKQKPEIVYEEDVSNSKRKEREDEEDDSYDYESEEEEVTAYDKLLELMKSKKSVDVVKKSEKRLKNSRNREQEFEDEDQPSDGDFENETEDSENDDDQDVNAISASSLDPFNRHLESFSNIEVGEWETMVQKSEALNGMNWGIRTPTLTPESDAKGRSEIQETLKKKLLPYFEEINGQSPISKELSHFIFNYKDLYFSETKWDKVSELEKTYVIHCLNHIFKTRDKILRNNVKVKLDESLEVRDQGFTRPKVLILLPLKSSAFRVVNMILEMSGCTDHLNKKRFLGEFGPSDEDQDVSFKPPDYKYVFSGNTDDCFRIGLKFTRKTVKLFSAFEQSDIIVASPIGLRLCLMPKKDKIDNDFLSSIEILVLDQAHIFTLQNLEHLDLIMENLNHLPREAKDCDFSRVRTFYLDNVAQKIRQTLIFSDYSGLELERIFRTFCKNYAGKVKSLPAYDDSMLKTVISPTTKQIFHRIHSIKSLSTSPDDRFAYFVKKTLPMIRASPFVKGHVCIFVPSYFDFVRIRNYMKSELLSHVTLNEYSTSSQIARARTKFLNGQAEFLLVTERFQFFLRYRIKGIKHLVFYAPPENPLFYPELVNYMDGSGLDSSSSNSINEGATCLCLFSLFDKLAMERIVGSKRWLKFVNLSQRKGKIDFVLSA